MAACTAPTSPLGRPQCHCKSLRRTPTPTGSVQPNIIVWTFVEGIEPIVEDFEAKLRSAPIPTTPPSKDRLLKAACSAYWEMVGEANGNLQHLDLGLGLLESVGVIKTIALKTICVT